MKNALKTRLHKKFQISLTMEAGKLKSLHALMITEWGTLSKALDRSMDKTLTAPEAESRKRKILF